MKNGLTDGQVGHASGIRIQIPFFTNTEFMWDAVGRVKNSQHPSEDNDLLFVAESENQPLIERILEDANKLPIARADVRLMFFRANDRETLDLFFERLRSLFEQHRKTQFDDVYILAGMDMQSLIYLVRKLTIRRPFANEGPWEEF